MKKIAIVTYNRIGQGQYPNGVIQKEGTEIYLAQNGHLSKWAAPAEIEEEERVIVRERAAQSVVQQIKLEDMDHVYLYVGNSGGEETIRQTKEISADKITYVMCDCNSGLKRRLIQEAGNANAELIYAECGGRETLQEILEKL